MRKPTTSAVLWLLRFAVRASATFLALCITAHAQRTMRIPADVPTIQSAIDAAGKGDILLVAPGTYFENLNFHGKAITLRSAEGPTITILDGRHLAPVITFTTGETRSTTLNGFTLRNGAPPGSSAHGGGILLVNASPTISGNILTHNLCTAIDATDSAPLLTRNTLRETQPDAVCATQPVAPAVFSGGAPTLLHNIVEHNDLTAAEPISAGIALIDAHAIVQANIVRDNVTRNDAPSAVLFSGTQSTAFEQNLVYANISHCGPAVFLAAPGTFLNNTVADNVTCDSAAEVSTSSPQLTLANNILASSSNHPALACALAPSAFDHNLLHNIAGPILTSTCPDQATNLLTDPLFSNRTRADYHLSPHSPGVDGGTTTYALTQCDLDDILRVQNGRVDLGPYEHVVPKALNVSTTSLNATPSPAEAFQSITLTAKVTAANAIPTGSVTFAASQLAIATVPLDASGRADFTTTTLPAVTLPITATYNGSDTIATSSSTLTVRINPSTTLLSFAITPSNADETQTVHLSATVEAPLSTQSPSGQVQFLELTTHTILATVVLDATGHATSTLPSMPTGAWLIDAAYLGSPNFASVTLPAADALTLNIANRGYVLSTNTPSVTIQSGHHAPVALTLTSIGTFAAGIELSCTSLPANATCTFSPASLSLTAGATIPVTLTLDTNAIPGFLSMVQPVSVTALAFLPSCIFLSLKRRRRALAKLFLLLSLTGCSSSYPAQVPSGTYPVQVIAQATGSPTKQAIPLTLVVTN